jgi:benzoyl-CoA reductase/2-hydroxyglutaryl-CoA dehydratase subunit BcrC/BadD/HgdB
MRDPGQGPAVLVTRAARTVDRLVEDSYAAAQAGGTARPVAWVMGGVPAEILQCFDINAVFPEQYGTICAMKGATRPFIDYAETDGFSSRICGYLRVALGYARMLAGRAPLAEALFGGMARPQMFLGISRLCDPRSKIFEAMRRYLEAPAFIFDAQKPPVEDPACQSQAACEHYIHHNANGLLGLVTFLEEQTGRKLKTERLRDAVRNSLEGWRLFHEIDELRRAVPCPMPSEDHFSTFMPYLSMPGEARCVQFYQDLRDELQERVRQGQGIVPAERFRLLWLGQPAFYDMAIFNYLESRGAVSVFESMYHPSRYRELDTADPFRALTERLFWGWDWGESDGSEILCGLVPGSRILRLVRDYRIDGVIAHSTISCRSVSIGQKHTAKLLRDQAGLPVLYLESDMTDPRSYSASRVRYQVDAFIEVLQQRKP